VKKRYDIAPLQGMHPEIGLLAASLQDGTREWRSELHKAPEEMITWQACPDGHSIGAVILHIIDVEAYWIEEFAAGKKRSKREDKLLLAEETQQYHFRWPKPPAKPLRWYLDLQDEIRARTLETLKRFDHPDEFIARGESGTRFTVRWVLSHVVQHEAFHGGQAMLLKLLYKHNKRG